LASEDFFRFLYTEKKENEEKSFIGSAPSIFFPLFFKMVVK